MNRNPATVEPNQKQNIVHKAGQMRGRIAIFSRHDHQFPRELAGGGNFGHGAPVFVAGQRAPGHGANAQPKRRQIEDRIE